MPIGVYYKYSGGQGSAIALYRNAVVIFNPFAGGFRGRRRKRLDAAVAQLQADGHRVSVLATRGPGTGGEIAREAIENGADLILPAGGDGTINEVLPGIVKTGVPLGILPAGTANVLACELKLGRNAQRAAAEIKNLVPVRIAAGALKLREPSTSRYFLLMAGAGFDAHIVYNLNLPLKYKAGEIAYWGGAVRQIGRRLEEFEVEIDGRTYVTSFALVSRVRNYGGYLEIATGASLLADEFQVVLFEGASAFRFYAVYLPAIIAGVAPRVKGLRFLSARQVCLRGPRDARVYIQVDGEHAGRLPAGIEIVPDSLTLLVPPAFRDRA